MAAHVQWTGRPASKEHEHPYRAPPAPSNPVVRGLPLYYGAKIITSSTLIQNLLWGNAGFDSLRNRAELEGVEPRYEPLVVKSSGTRVSTAEALQTLSNEDWTSRTPSEKLYPGILDYHEAYKTGRTTPTAVAKVLLPLVRRDADIPSRHSVAFLSSRVDLVMLAAEASTKRYKEGKSLGPLDGVPVAVKDEEDVTGYPKCVGSKLDLKDKHDATSYCVQAWQDAGAVLIGKTNMHEHGMDTTNNSVSSLKDLTPANQVLMSVGSKTPGVDFLQAQKMRMLLMQHLAHLYENHPGMIIVTPTTPNAGWTFEPQDLKYGCSNGNMSLRSMEYVWLANLTGCPAISVPAAYLEPEKGTGRIPIGFMGMGEWCSEDELLAFGYDCERYLHDVYENGRVRPATYVEVLEAARAEP
ncbi:hypothetical protein LTR17_006430 [Elasticomyces elasticus]|nr:hypothetical protein LTR17_006430 [Elasticomyces elasticus]